MLIPPFRGALRRLLTGGLLLLATSSWAIDLSYRHSLVSGSFVVGYAGLVDSGSAGQHVYELVDHDLEAVTDSGSVSGNFKGTPVVGAGGFHAAHSYTVSDASIQVEFAAASSLSSPYTYLSAGAQATSTLSLEFRITEDTPFTLSASLAGATGNTVFSGGKEQFPVADGGVILRPAGSSRGGWVFDTAGHHNVSGVLRSDTYLLYTNAHAKVNGDFTGSAQLVLGPVPEPATLALWLAGLGPLWLLARRRAAGAALSLVALSAAPAHAAGTFEIGQPAFFAGYVAAYGPTNTVDESQIVRRDQTEAPAGWLGALSQIGTRRDTSPALIGGTIDQYGKVFTAIADTPWLLRSPAADTVTGGTGFTQVSQSFVKTAANASLKFTYTAGYLELFHDREFGTAYDLGAYARLAWEVTVQRNDAPGQVLMRESQQVVLTVVNDTVVLYPDRSASDGSPMSALWQWDCPDCGTRLRGQAPATLLTPFTDFVDLSSIPFDPTPGAPQVEFTVTYRLNAEAYVTGKALQASAYARDPLGSGSGVAFDGTALLATNHPITAVPEPAAPLLLAAGLAILAWRRASRDQGAGAR